MCNNQPMMDHLITLLAKCYYSIGFIMCKMAKIITLLAGITLVSVQASLWDVKVLGLKICSLCITSLPINLESRHIL